MKELPGSELIHILTPGLGITSKLCHCNGKNPVIDFEIFQFVEWSFFPKLQSKGFIDETIQIWPFRLGFPGWCSRDLTAAQGYTSFFHPGTTLYCAEGITSL